MTDAKTIANHPICDTAVREQVEQLDDRLSTYEEIFTSDVGESVQAWLDEHPEATTTVGDGTITDEKLSTQLKGMLFGESAYYDEITFVKERHYDTDCYFATIPVLDLNGNVIEVYVDHDNNVKNPLEHAIADNTTLTINGDCSLDVGEPSFRNPIRIGKGVVLNSRSFDGYGNLNPRYIGIKADRSHVEYVVDSDITPEQMLADGCINVFSSYAKSAENAELMDLSGIYWNDYTYVPNKKGIPMMLGFTADDSIIILACDGRTTINLGLSLEEGTSLMLDRGCVDVYVVDGGGSTCLCDKGSKINRNIDGDGTVVRSGKYSVNVKKPFENVSEQTSTSKIGVEKQRLIEQIIPYVDSLRDGISGIIYNLETKNIDMFPAKGYRGVFWINNTDANIEGTKPLAYGQGLLFCLVQSASYWRQVYIPVTSGYAVKGRTYTISTGTWSAWADTGIAKKFDELGSVSFETFTVNASSSKTFTFSNSTICNITINGTNVDQHSMVILSTTSIGAVRYTPLLLGSLITLETQTNSIIITNAHTAEAIVTFQVSRGKVSESS